MNEHDLVILNKAAGDLGEHFDAVCILVSVILPNGKTQMVRRGYGNFYAQRGMAASFLEDEGGVVFALENLDKPDAGEGVKKGV
jgi:hypothetical protein